MTSPLSIGDALLLAKIAFRIGQALTTGRKSAPAELREVESQLYSLSAALTALTEARESESSSPLLVDPSKLPETVPSCFKVNQDIVLGMLDSCRQTLSHLESVVQKYSIIGTAPDPGQPLPLPKRWSRRLKADWKKIEWTTEGGDLAALKADLTIQTNSLNLILGVVINSQAARLQTDVDRVTEMLGEIHEWFVDNLKSKAAVPRTSATPAPGEADPLSSTSIRFQIFESSGQQLTLICPEASLSQKSAKAGNHDSHDSRSLFTCCCPASTGAANHRQTVEAYGLSPLSFATIIAGSERSWLLYKVTNTSTDQLKALVVKGVSPDAMTEFEDILVHGLSVAQARRMLSHNMSTMLAHASDLDSTRPKANILNIMSTASTPERPITTVKFTSENGYYLRHSIEHVQVLHYKSIDLERLARDAILPQTAFEENKQAEIIISYGKDENDSAQNVVRTILHLKWNTKIDHQADRGVVIVKEVDCTGFDSSEVQRPTILATVEFDFSVLEAALQLYREIEAMRMDLFVIHLQYPREDEKPLLKLQAQSVHTERMHIRDADLTIFQNTTNNRFRLVVQSRNGLSILSQELKDDFFDKLASQGRPDYTALSYEVHMESAGKRVIRQCARGYAYLAFTDHKIDQVFSIGLEAVSKSAQSRIEDA